MTGSPNPQMIPAYRVAMCDGCGAIRIAPDDWEPPEHDKKPGHYPTYWYFLRGSYTPCCTAIYVSTDLWRPHRKWAAGGVSERYKVNDGSWFEKVLHPVGYGPNRAADSISKGICPACDWGRLKPSEDGWLVCTGSCWAIRLEWRLT